MIYRELEPDEFSKIPKDALDGYGLPRHNVRVMAALDPEGEIRAIWCVLACIHAEPLWVDPKYRKSGTVLRRLWEGVRRILKDAGQTCAASVILDDRADTQRIAKWVGAREVPGKLYVMEVDVPRGHIEEKAS